MTIVTIHFLLGGKQHKNKNEKQRDQDPKSLIFYPYLATDKYICVNAFYMYIMFYICIYYKILHIYKHIIYTHIFVYVCVYKSLGKLWSQRSHLSNEEPACPQNFFVKTLEWLCARICMFVPLPFPQFIWWNLNPTCY